jgi:hypothetical protein
MIEHAGEAGELGVLRGQDPEGDDDEAEADQDADGGPGLAEEAAPGGTVGRDGGVGGVSGDGGVGRAWGGGVGRGRGAGVSPTLGARAGAYGTEPGVRTVIRARRR